MITPERISALQGFGYDQDEARFLCIAALQSGYFVRRQFLFFVGHTKAWKGVPFLDKLRTKRHSQVTHYRHNRTVYHLSAKPLYRALGEQDNRNRRERQPSTIKNKLMGLDFVLDHPTFHYLATEREKLDYFTGALKIAPRDLPTRWYESARGQAKTAKCFVDKYPVFLAVPLSGTTPVVHFCYVDEGAQSADGFSTYLSQYSKLLSALPDFRIIYIAQHAGLFDAARRSFGQFSAQSGRADVPLDPVLLQLLNYFQARKAYEARDFSGFDTTTLIRYREQKRQFTAERYEHLYATWKMGGNAAVLTDLSPEEAAKEMPIDRFSTYVVEHNYDLFGNITSAPKQSGDTVETQTNE